MISTVLRFNSCCTERFHSSHSGALIVPMIAPTAGGLNLTPNGSLVLIVLKLSVTEKASADVCHVSGAPFGSKGHTPALEGEFLILRETEAGGLPSRLSTKPAAGLS